MGVLGWYCRAYEGKRFKEFSGWAATAAREIQDDEVLYLHEDFAVTEGVLRSEKIIYEQATDAWREFCTATLDFQLPDYMQKSSEPATVTQESRP